MKKRIKIKYYSSPCGEMVLGSCEERLCLCDWKESKHRVSVDNRLQRLLRGEMMEGDSKVIDKTCGELDEYFAGKRRRFDVILNFCGTDFQVKVWRALLKIGYGETVSYSELAKRVGMPTGVRVVANAIGTNAISVIVPCHRVIGTNNNLTGYSGGLETKQYLLDLEFQNKK